MRREALLLGASFALLATGCRTMERLSFIRPTAARGDYTQVAPTYKVSDKGRRGTAVSAGQLLANATELYRAGRMGEAEQLAQKALRIDPASADAHTLLAATAAARGAVAESGKHYQHAVALSSSGTYANNYGTWLCANGRAAESLGWFDKALADPDYATPVAAFANAGACARESGQLDLAESRWRQALALQPENLPALSGMADLQFTRERFLEARAFAERWLALTPADATGLQLAATIEQKLGDNVAAQRYLSRLQATFPGPTTDPRTQ